MNKLTINAARCCSPHGGETRAGMGDGFCSMSPSKHPFGFIFPRMGPLLFVSEPYSVALSTLAMQFEQKLPLCP